MKYEYYVTHPQLTRSTKEIERMRPPEGAREDINSWLNDMGFEGWELVTCGSTHWYNVTTEDWWIFRRELQTGD